MAKGKSNSSNPKANTSVKLGNAPGKFSKSTAGFCGKTIAGLDIFCVALGEILKFNVKCFADNPEISVQCYLPPGSLRGLSIEADPPRSPTFATIIFDPSPYKDIKCCWRNTPNLIQSFGAHVAKQNALTQSHAT